MKKTIMLIVLDGWGYREETLHNAVAASKKPFFDSLWKKYPHSLLEASGLAVGLPEGQMGNSEVGHTTIGSGSVLDTDLVRIDKSAKAGEFSKNPSIASLFNHVQKHDSTLHVMGLVSDGGVHSHQNHLHAFIKASSATPIKRIAIHVFTDGRDTGPMSGGEFIRQLESEIKKLDPSGTRIFIASLSGRYYAMDRDNNWDRMKKAEDAVFHAHGPHVSLQASEHLTNAYAQGIKDELLEPVIIQGVHGHGAPIKAHDGVFMFNFRSDRMRMIATRLMEHKDIHVTAMTEYSREYTFPVAFPPRSIETTLGAEISHAGLTQTRIAETEKFPHATYFLNGGQEKPHKNEKHVMLDSRKDVKTHDEAPEMRAEAIADAAIKEIESGTDFIFVNFANPDMVGHTANVPAIITAIQTVDTQLKRVIDALDAKGGIAFVTADHGNAEVNIDPVTGDKHTSHTINPVPAIVTNTDYSLKNGALSDIAPTILALLGVKASEKMTGKSLVGKK